MQFILRKAFISLCLVATALLAACSVTPSVDQQQITEQTRIGRFAVLAFDKREGVNKDAVQGGFVWRDLGTNLVLDLTNPLGSTLARVEVSDFQSVLINSAGQRMVAPSPDDLLARVLDGRPLPVSGIRYWVKGELMPTAQALGVTHDEQGRLLTAEQNGWQISLSEYDAKGPTRMHLLRNEPAERISVRLSVDR
ncbi:outer membrane lipoprotein LolB [Oligella urethralis]|uniref:outer membrane lipoprotein LolB n=1 Tax=Oligella urethralis TaxID=90245 RepID=UPI0003795D20|nr:outer membrane lipoprotein LolB [Oligella urethralis]PMC17364.1 outer membrane lipoprotein LolB [Oligella urethralis]SUA64692.1 Outer-membrane lipoprotein lolB precursor [Oligella urethralis]